MLSTPPSLELIVQAHVALAMQHRYRMELAHPHTKEPMSQAQREDFLRKAFVEIAKGMGIDRFLQTPAERLDQFAVMSVVKEHDTAGLIRSLVNSFMIAYACPETCDRAFAALVQIEGLRAEVADDKGQGQQSNNPGLKKAAKELESTLAASAGALNIKVLIGADRLYVKSSQPIKELPRKFQGFAVEAIVNGH